MAIPVLDGQKPVSLISRHTFLLNFGAPYGRALYSLKPITALFKTPPLVVDAIQSVEEVGQRIVDENPAALLEGYIVVDDDGYSGVGTGLDVLTWTLDHTEQQNSRMAEAIDAANRANNSKSEFLAQMSHELRTPLNAIIGFGDIIAKQTLGSDASMKYAEYAQDIADAGRHLLDLLTDILDISKIEAGRMSVTLVETELGAQLEPILKTMSAYAKEQGVTIHVENPTDKVPVFADERALRQILVNLLSNAIKFTARGDVITVKLAQGSNTSFSSLVVEDTGSGIPVEKQKLIWQPFERLDNSYVQAAGGTGLGLTLVKHLVALHRGKIYLNSIPDRGTTIWVRLPANSDVYSKAPEEPNPVADLSPGAIAENLVSGRPKRNEVSSTETKPSLDLQTILGRWTETRDRRQALPSYTEFIKSLDADHTEWMSVYVPAGIDDFQIISEGSGLLQLTGAKWQNTLISEIPLAIEGGLDRLLSECCTSRQPILDIDTPHFFLIDEFLHRLSVPVKSPDGLGLWVLIFLLPSILED